MTLHVEDIVTLGDTLTPCPRLLRHHNLASNLSGSVQHWRFGSASSTGGCPLLHPLPNCPQHSQLLWAPAHTTGPWTSQAQGLSQKEFSHLHILGLVEWHQPRMFLCPRVLQIHPIGGWAGCVCSPESELLLCFVCPRWLCCI